MTFAWASAGCIAKAARKREGRTDDARRGARRRTTAGRPQGSTMSLGGQSAESEIDHPAAPSGAGPARAGAAVDSKEWDRSQPGLSTNRILSSCFRTHRLRAGSAGRSLQLRNLFVFSRSPKSTSFPFTPDSFSFLSLSQPKKRDQKRTLPPNGELSNPPICHRE